jgi:hypothetical protein
MDTSHDGFEKKRGMVKQLLNMLKSHASNEVSKGIGAEKEGMEVSGGMPAPEPPMGLEQTKHSSVDHNTIEANADMSPDQHKSPSGNLEGMAPESIMEHPHRKKSFEQNAAKMADGGMAKDSDEPEEFHMDDELARRKGVDGSADEDAVSNLPGGVRDELGLGEAHQSENNDRMLADDQDNNQSMFQAFLKRGKKK